jgi:hypothetical protein
VSDRVDGHDDDGAHNSLDDTSSSSTFVPCPDGECKLLSLRLRYFSGKVPVVDAVQPHTAGDRKHAWFS